MSLRPRYSLLTLLVLTALVAGGVKLWRGPHRAKMRHPPTAVEQKLLARATHLEYLMPDVNYEYVYIKGGDAHEFLALCLRPRYEMPVYLARQTETPGTSLPQQSDQNLCLVFLGRIIYAGPSLRQPSAASPVIEDVTTFEDCYLLTIKWEIYQVLFQARHLNAKLIKLSDISDPIAREMVSSELEELRREAK